MSKINIPMEGVVIGSNTIAEHKNASVELYEYAL